MDEARAATARALAAEYRARELTADRERLQGELRAEKQTSARLREVGEGERKRRQGTEAQLTAE